MRVRGLRGGGGGPGGCSARGAGRQQRWRTHLNPFCGAHGMVVAGLLEACNIRLPLLLRADLELVHGLPAVVELVLVGEAVVGLGALQLGVLQDVGQTVHRGLLNLRALLHGARHGLVEVAHNRLCLAQAWQGKANARGVRALKKKVQQGGRINARAVDSSSAHCAHLELGALASEGALHSRKLFGMLAKAAWAPPKGPPPAAAARSVAWQVLLQKKPTQPKGPKTPWAPGPLGQSWPAGPRRGG